MKKKFLTILATLALSLSACALFPGELTPTPTPGSSQSKDLVNSFISADDNEVRYVSLNKSSLTLIKGDSFAFRIDAYKENEEPDFSHNWMGVEWGSENTNVATIDEDGVMTAAGEGVTRIFGRFFPTIGAYCTINVIPKQLESISVENARKTYILGDTFSPIFTCVATFVGGHKEEVVPEVDYSSVDIDEEGTYTVNVSYTFGDVTKETSYEVEVVDNPTYEAKSLLYTCNDLYQDREYGWYCPHTGNVKGLVIPINFTDTDAYLGELSEKLGFAISKAKVKRDLYTAFYGESGPDGWNSVASYYHKVSGGTLTITGTVSDWFEAGVSSADIDTEDKIDDLVKEAVEWYFERNPSENINDYDSDHNGVFDSLNIIYGCPDEAHDIPLYWGKISSQSVPIVPSKDGSPAVKYHMWASYEDLYRDTNHSEVDSHVYTHETGHTFGLEDYYDYGENDIRPMAGGTMMFHNTHQQDPFSTLVLGWSEVIVPETACVIELEDFQTSHQMILLSPRPETVNSPFDEYILVELYAPNGVNEFDSKYPWRGFYSQGAQEPGIRIWHVNAILAERLDESAYGFTTNPLTEGFSKLALSNTWGENHGSILGPDYYNYSLLFEIRNDTSITYTPTTDDEHCMFSDETLFHPGDTFNTSTYRSQFVHGPLLDNEKEFNWSVIVESIVEADGSYKATIRLELN